MPFIIGTPATMTLSFTATLLPFNNPEDAPLIDVLTYQALRDFARSQVRYWPDGRVNVVYPNGDGGRDIPDSTEGFVEWVWRVYMTTGDRDQLISDVLWAETKAALDALAGKAAAHGFPSGLAGPDGVRVWACRHEGGRWSPPELVSTTGHPSFNQEVLAHADGSGQCFLPGAVGTTLCTCPLRCRRSESRSNYWAGRLPSVTWRVCSCPLRLMRRLT